MLKKYLSTSGNQIIYSGDEIQERDSVLCCYWDLYYLIERQKGKSVLETIHNAEFSFTDQIVKSYFVKQKKQTECVPGSERFTKVKNGRTMMKCKCAECGI